MKTIVRLKIFLILLLAGFLSSAQEKKTSAPIPASDTIVKELKPLCSFDIWISDSCKASEYYTLKYKPKNNQGCELKGRLALYYSLSEISEAGNPMLFLDTNEHLKNDQYALTKPGYYTVMLWSTEDSILRFGEISQKAAAEYCPQFEMYSELTYGYLENSAILAPKKSRHIDKIDLVIFDPMGNEIYKTHDADFRWNLRRQDNGQPIESGVYYYSCTIHEKNLRNPAQRKISGSISVKSE